MLEKKPDNINPFWLLLIIPGMHLFGSCVLAAFYIGPSMALGGIILSLFGWYFLPFEALGASVMFEFYKPLKKQRITLTLKKGFLVCMIGAIVFAPFIPKEDGSQIIGWVGSASAGFSSTLFAFTCTHIIKIKA